MKTKKKIIPIVALCCVLVLSLGFLSSCREDKPILIGEECNYLNYFALFGRDSKFIVEYEFMDTLATGGEVLYYIEIKDGDSFYTKPGDNGLIKTWQVCKYKRKSGSGDFSPYAKGTYSFRYSDPTKTDNIQKEEVEYLGRNCIKHTMVYYHGGISETIVDNETNLILSRHNYSVDNKWSLRLEVKVLKIF